MKRLRVQKNNMQKIYGILWDQCTTGMNIQVQGESDYNKNPGYFDWLWLVEKKLNPSGITHTSNTPHADLHALKGVFNLRHCEMEFMDYFYKSFDSTLAPCKLAGCDATSFTGLDKHND